MDMKEGGTNESNKNEGLPTKVTSSVLIHFPFQRGGVGGRHSMVYASIY